VNHDGYKLFLKSAEWSLVQITHKTLSQKNGVKTLENYCNARERKVDSRRSLDLVLILRPSAEMKATADELRVPNIFKCYGLENVGVGQIDTLFTFSGVGQLSRCTGRIARDIRRSQRSGDEGNVPGERLSLIKPHTVFCCRILRGCSAPL